jgi:hypothetical protein
VYPGGDIVCLWFPGGFRLVPKGASEKDRRYQRIPTPQGVWVAWHDGVQQSVSRVRDLNVGGLFIYAPTPSPLGTVITILLSGPEGEIRGKAAVRNIIAGQGMGIEIVNMEPQDATRLQKLIARLLNSGASDTK